MNIKFTKMQAFGNDYVYIDAIHQKIEDPNALASRISDRHFGLGSDGLVLICPSEVCDFRMRMFNPDGSEAEMCGNALRSTAKFVYYHRLTDKTTITIETLGGLQTVDLTVENGSVTNIRACIGKPELTSERIPVLTDEEHFIHQPIVAEGRAFYASSLSWGNPHTVIEIDDAEHFDVEKYGPAIEQMGLFPKKTNVTFAELVDRTHINIREWERNTGETIGCATGCCSAVVILHIMGLVDRTVDVRQPGGVLHVEWAEDDRVFMTGPSYVVYEGEYVDEAFRLTGRH